MSERPVIGITMGDPSGVGPEIVSKMVYDPEIHELCKPLILGDPGLLSPGVKGLAKISVNEISEPHEAIGIPRQADLIALSHLKKNHMIPGKPSLEGGKAMVRYITRAVGMAMNGEVEAVVTGPINKALMNHAGCHFEGHTQLIAHLAGAEDYVMMLAGERLRVTLTTIHCPLKDVSGLINNENVYRTIKITYKALKEDFGFKDPRIAVAALNPHAGESGLFGSEEDEIIIPAIRRANDDGYKADGPYPPDTVFFKAVSGRFDAVVSMYHDQGLIPLKLLHFADAVNVTLGLPIIRTSVDHGTAYDIAGKGKADPSSLKAAVRMAVNIVKNRGKGKGKLTGD